MATALMGELAMFAVTLDMEDIPTFAVGRCGGLGRAWGDVASQLVNN